MRRLGHGPARGLIRGRCLIGVLLGIVPASRVLAQDDIADETRFELEFAEPIRPPDREDADLTLPPPRPARPRGRPHPTGTGEPVDRGSVLAELGGAALAYLAPVALALGAHCAFDYTYGGGALGCLSHAFESLYLPAFFVPAGFLLAGGTTYAGDRTGGNGSYWASFAGQALGGAAAFLLYVFLVAPGNPPASSALLATGALAVLPPFGAIVGYREDCD